MELQAVSDAVTFWQCDTDAISKAIEKEIYEAVKILLTEEGSGHLNCYFNNHSLKKATLSLFIEGSEEYNSIERKFTLEELVDDYLSDRTNPSGAIILDEDETEDLARMANELRSYATRIDEFMSKAKKSLKSMKLPSDSLPRVDGNLSNWTTTIQPSPGTSILSLSRREREYRYCGPHVSSPKVPYEPEPDK